MKYKPVSFLNQPGPRIASNSVKVLKHGKIMRLSPDLLTSLKRKGREWYFKAFVDDKGKELVLEVAGEEETGVLRAWKSNPGRSESVLISSVGILQSLGIDEKDAEGSYRAEVIGGKIHVRFNEEI